GSGVDGTVSALTVYNDNLIAGGDFTTAGGNPASNIAQWDGSSWSALDSGTNDAVDALTVYNGELIAGGDFTSAGEHFSAHWARWGPADPPIAICQDINKTLVAGAATVNASEIDNGSTAGEGCTLTNIE